MQSRPGGMGCIRTGCVATCSKVGGGTRGCPAKKMAKGSYASKAKCWNKDLLLRNKQSNYSGTPFSDGRGMDDPQIWNSSSRFHQAIHFLSCAFHRMRSRSHCLLASLPVGLGVVGGVGVSAINERLSLCRDCSRHSYSSRDLITLTMLSLLRSLCSCHQASSFASSISFESMMLVYGNTRARTSAEFSLSSSARAIGKSMTPARNSVLAQ